MTGDSSGHGGLPRGARHSDVPPDAGHVNPPEDPALADLPADTVRGDVAGGPRTRDLPEDPRTRERPPGVRPEPRPPAAHGRGRGGRRGAGRGEGGERAMVPEAEFRSYYGHPIIRPPVWHHDIPAYLFTGGLAAGSALLAAGADVTGRPVMRRGARLAAMAALGASTYFLINDLGRPERFHHMLRVAKPTSPMSMGTWILAGFGAGAGAAVAGELAPLLPAGGVLGVGRWILPAVGRAGGLVAAGFAPALATYTAVLLADTAVPSWHEAYPELPFVFGGSALASGAGVGLIAAPAAEAGPARRLAVAGATLELMATKQVEYGKGLLSQPFHHGSAGRQLAAARYLTIGGAVGAVLGAQPGGVGPVGCRAAGRLRVDPLRDLPRRRALGRGPAVQRRAATETTGRSGNERRRGVWGPERSGGRRRRMEAP
jgi:hypothetical protein